MPDNMVGSTDVQGVPARKTMYNPDGPQVTGVA